MEGNKNTNFFSQIRNGSLFLLMEVLYRLTPVVYFLAFFAKNGSAFDRCGLRHAEAVTFIGIMHGNLKNRGCIFRIPSK